MNLQLSPANRRQTASLWICLLCLCPLISVAQSAGWQQLVWREPQVRYLLTDLTLGGNPELYRRYAKEEKDPDSCEAVRLWDAGVRVINTNDFERRWLTNKFGKDGKIMRVVLRGSERTITGDEPLLTSDLMVQRSEARVILADLCLGAEKREYEKLQSNPTVADALRRWSDGCRVLNLNWFERRELCGKKQVVYLGTTNLIDGAFVRLNSDLPYPEPNVRYFLADMFLGGGRGFYYAVSESAHEMGCREAVARFDAGVKIVNLNEFERKTVNGKVLITRKGETARISGKEIKLSTD